jgi:pimeloyl-ACP methyl ester carboxylesterase
MTATQYITAPDGVRIAYDRSGTGPALVLLHGGGRDRADWHALGYVARLRERFTVITVDLRGHGASDAPADPASYTAERMCRDILAVADACGADRFSLWGFSYGGNLGRYLGAQSDRLARLIVMGVPFGPGAAGDFRAYIGQFRARWEAIARALSDGTLDRATLAPEELDALEHGQGWVRLAWLSAMLEWRAVEPADLRCPTLWLVGSENPAAVESVHSYGARLTGTAVQAEVIDGLDHSQELRAVDTVLPVMLAFMQEDR